MFLVQKWGKFYLSINFDYFHFLLSIFVHLNALLLIEILHEVLIYDINF